jgi:nitrous oxidase accessory protein NosD
MSMDMKKTALALILIFALTFSAVASQFFEPTRAQMPTLPTPPEPIYIESDGSINPTSALITSSGDIYTLNGNIYNTIEIDRPNTVLQGSGFIITNPIVTSGDAMAPIGWLPGVHVVADNVTVTGIAFESCFTGVSVENSSDVTLSRNTIQGSTNDIVILSSSQVNIISNNIAVSESQSGSGIVFLTSNPTAAIPDNALVEGNLIAGSSGYVATANTQPSQNGIWAGFNDSNMTQNSIVNINGIALYFSGSNDIISDNNFQNNNQGIRYNGVSTNFYNNAFYLNNFHNAVNVQIGFITPPPPSRWDNGSAGNYWSDYNGTDSNGDGVGDTPYIIQSTYENYTTRQNVTVNEAQDNYPLMNPVETSNIASDVPQLPTTTITPPSTPNPTSTTSALPTTSRPPHSPSRHPWLNLTLG